MQCPAWCSNITKAWSINRNYCDWEAAFEFDGPALPVPCRLLFQQDNTGPWSAELLRTHQQQQDFAILIMAEHNNCKTAHDRRKAAAQVVEGQAAGSNSTASKLKAAKNEAMVEQAKKSSAQAKRTLNQRAANRKVLFGTDSTASNASGTGPMGPPANPGGASASAGGSGSGGAAGSAGDEPVPKAKGKAAK